MSMHDKSTLLEMNKSHIVSESEVSSVLSELPVPLKEKKKKECKQKKRNREGKKANARPEERNREEKKANAKSEKLQSKDLLKELGKED